MKYKMLLVVLLIFPLDINAAIEVDDYGNSIGTSSSSYGYEDGLKMREKHRAGVGVAVAGAYGIMGLNLELNLTPRWSSLIGFGVSTEFQTMNFQVRRMLGGEALLPYLGLGFANWTSNGETEGGIQETNPGFVAEQFMSEEDRELGRISENILYPAVGIQYLILDGPWRGIGVNLELDLLLELATFEAAPTGSLGVNYYF